MSETDYSSAGTDVFSTATTVKAQIIEDALGNAQVYLYLNENVACDDGEPTTIILDSTDEYNVYTSLSIIVDTMWSILSGAGEINKEDYDTGLDCLLL